MTGVQAVKFDGVGDKAIVVAFRSIGLLPLDDCLYALQAEIVHLTRSSAHQCLRRLTSIGCLMVRAAWSAVTGDRNGIRTLSFDLI